MDIHELIGKIEEFNQQVSDLQEEVSGLKELVFTQGKTLEGLQQLLVKAGEYQGKPRGRLPK